MDKFWNIKAGDKEAKLDIFGVLSEWATSEDETALSSKTFLTQFRKINPQAKLEVMINSPGGSVATGLSIYEILKMHKGPVSIRVAGIACSAATIITSVPNAKVTVSDGSVLMIHRVSTMAMGTPADLRKEAEAAEKMEEVIANIYVSKTGKSLEEVNQKMAEETYFTAQEAVDFGLADVLDSQSRVTNSLEKGVLFVNGLKIDSDITRHLPKKFVDVEALASAINENPTKETTMDLKQLKAEYPELVEAISTQAAEAERARIQDIEAIALPGFENLVAQAKFDGKTTAAELSVQIVKAQKENRTKFAAGREADAEDLQNLKPGSGELSDQEAEARVIAAAKKAFSN